MRKVAACSGDPIKHFIRFTYHDASAFRTFPAVELPMFATDYLEYAQDDGVDCIDIADSVVVARIPS